VRVEIDFAIEEMSTLANTGERRRIHLVVFFAQCLRVSPPNKSTGPRA
jgi:hypothetical protein